MSEQLGFDSGTPPKPSKPTDIQRETPITPPRKKVVELAKPLDIQALRDMVRAWPVRSDIWPFVRACDWFLLAHTELEWLSLPQGFFDGVIAELLKAGEELKALDIQLKTVPATARRTQEEFDREREEIAERVVNRARSEA